MDVHALKNIRVLDLSRILAGPVCTQILGDLGADVIKIERPGTGDDTRSWGPPFLLDTNGNPTQESAYYLCANRNKRSLALDIARPEGQEIIHRLLEKSDVLIENFKVGGLEKYGLSYEQVKDRYPRLIYASISGFGQSGPLAHEPGYDFLAQGMGGLMAATGRANDGPTKAGVAISDYVTGLYTAIGILSALQARTHTGRGQRVDCALLDSTIAMMTNVAQYYLTSGKVAPRVGNAHSTIVPYQEFETSDGHVIIAVGNDSQFRIFAAMLGHTDWAQDPRFATNAARVMHRDALISLIAPILKTRNTTSWVDACRDADIPAGPIYRMDQVFADPQVQTRKMVTSMAHPLSQEPIDLVSSPLNFSATPVDYRHAPPILGEHTISILQDELGLTPEECKKLQDSGIINS